MNEGNEVHVIGVTTASCDNERINDVEWMRRADARRLCGVGKDILDEWVADEKVEAHKLHSGKNGTVIFSAADIRRAIESSPRYMPGRGFAKPPSKMI